MFHALAHCPGRALETLCFHRLLQTAIAPPTSLVFGWEAVLVALAPEYMVFRSWAVFLLFAGFATIPVLLTAIFRRRISRRLVRVWLAALALGLVLIAPKLGRMASPAALSYWLFWVCSIGRDFLGPLQLVDTSFGNEPTISPAFRGGTPRNSVAGEQQASRWGPAGNA